MNILILGANSQIGCELALQFSSGNVLSLSGRHREKLDSIAQACLNKGAIHASVHVNDFSNGVEPLVKEFQNSNLDLIINLVAATSRVKDSEFLPEQLEQYLLSDLLVPLQFIQNILNKSDKPIKLIFISSVLAAVRSPDRTLYASLKLLQEMTLRKIMARHPANLLLVKVGKVIPHQHTSPQARGLVKAICKAFCQGRTTLSYGLAGHFYVMLYYVQPIVFEFLVRTQRWLRSYGK